MADCWVRLSDLVVRSGLAKSKSEAERLIQQGGIHVQTEDGETTPRDRKAILTPAGVLHRRSDGQA